MLPPHPCTLRPCYGRILGFIDRIRNFFFHVAPQLYSRGLSGPRSRPTTSQKFKYWLLCFWGRNPCMRSLYAILMLKATTIWNSKFYCSLQFRYSKHMMRCVVVYLPQSHLRSWRRLLMSTSISLQAVRLSEAAIRHIASCLVYHTRSPFAATKLGPRISHSNIFGDFYGHSHILSKSQTPLVRFQL
jgi:hypothetical protein